MKKQLNVYENMYNVSSSDQGSIEIISIYSDNGKTLQELLEEIIKITIN